MELSPKRPSLVWFWGPNSIMVVYMDPLGEIKLGRHQPETAPPGVTLSSYPGRTAPMTLALVVASQPMTTVSSIAVRGGLAS